MEHPDLLPARSLGTIRRSLAQARAEFSSALKAALTTLQEPECCNPMKGSVSAEVPTTLAADGGCRTNSEDALWWSGPGLTYA